MPNIHTSTKENFCSNFCSLKKFRHKPLDCHPPKTWAKPLTWSSVRYTGKPPQNILWGPSDTTVETTPGMWVAEIKPTHEDDSTKKTKHANRVYLLLRIFRLLLFMFYLSKIYFYINN